MKKTKPTINIQPLLPLIIIGGVLSGVLIYLLVISPYFGFHGSVPASVRELYEKSSTLGDIGGKSLSVCTKDKSKMYQVGFHHGFGGELHYYTEHGKFIGTNEYQDHPQLIPKTTNAKA